MKVITVVLVSIKLIAMDNKKVFSLIIEQFSYDSSTLIVRRYGINWDDVLLLLTPLIQYLFYQLLKRVCGNIQKQAGAKLCQAQTRNLHVS